MQDLNEAVKLLKESKRIMLVGSPRITFDELASLVSLKLLFDEQKKSTSVFFSEDFTGPRQELLKKYEVKPQEELEALNYTISIPYKNGEVEKVSYDTKGEQVNIHIAPGKTEFDFDSVKYAVEGSNFDVIMIVGARKLEWLGDIYTSNKDLFESTKIIALNNLRGGQEFGDFKLVDDKKYTTSEMVYDLVSLLGGTQNEKIINSLLEGVLVGANLNNSGQISENTNTIIVNLINAGGDIRQAVKSVVSLMKEASAKTPAPQVEKIPEEKPMQTAQEEKPKQNKEIPEVKEEKPIGERLSPQTERDGRKSSNGVSGQREAIGKTKKSSPKKLNYSKEESSKGFIAPPSIEKSAKIPLGAPIKLEKATDN
jgi:hypothetical protein